MGRRKLGFEGWEERIYRRARVGDLEGQKSKTEPLGSVSGTPLETAVRGKGGRWWGGAYEVAAAAGSRVRLHQRGWWF